MKRRSFLFYSLATVVGSGLRIEKMLASTHEPDVFTIDLSTELTEVGSSKSVKKMIVVRTAEGNEAASFVAFSNKCTHRGCKVSFNSENNQFKCPCHKSFFNLKGEAIQGPAKKPLTPFKVAVAGQTLTITGED